MTATKFNPLVLAVHGFTLPCVATICFVMILYLQEQEYCVISFGRFIQGNVHWDSDDSKESVCKHFC